MVLQLCILSVLENKWIEVKYPVQKLMYVFYLEMMTNLDTIQPYLPYISRGQQMSRISQIQQPFWFVEIAVN